MQTRQKVKRQLLDQLDTMHGFDLPPKMVEQEFDNIWRQIVSEMGQTGRTFESEDTTEEAAREEYRKIAERRVRLGLVLSEIGERNKIEVTEPEVQRALHRPASPVPGPGAAAHRLLPRQSRRGRVAPRADLRGEGRRLPARAGQGHRQDRLPRGVDAGRGRRDGDTGAVTPSFRDSV